MKARILDIKKLYHLVRYINNTPFSYKEIGADYAVTFDVVGYLKADQDIAKYLKVVKEDGAPTLFIAAFEGVTKAKNMN